MITRRFLQTSALGMALLLVTATAVWADNAIADGDNATPIASSSLALGNVCSGTPTDGFALLGVSKNGSYGSPNVYKLSTNATFSAPTASAGLATAFPNSPTFEIPANWNTAANNTIAPAAGISLKVTLTTGTLGSFSGTVSLSLTGTSSDDDDTLVRSTSLTVTATVVDCTPADTTPPVISYVLSPTTPDGNNGWYRSNVTLTWTVTESESPGSLVKTGCVDQNITADQAEVTYSCSATSDGGSAGPVEVKIKRDATAPDVALVGGPEDGESYYFGSVPAAPTCEASDATSGLLVDPVLPTGYSTAVGSHTVTCAAEDNAGNTSSDSAEYTVLAWTLFGFYQPVDMNMLNTIKGGQTVPLKFNVYAGPTELTSTSVVKGFKATLISCGATATDGVDAIEITSTGGTSLRYDSTGGQFIQNWQTPKTSNLCYVATLTLQDNTSIFAYFKTK